MGRVRDAVRPMPDDLDTLLDELYALPLERFVRERTALAKALRAEGRREDAARVAELAKPSVVAWAVNQVVRAQPEAAQALWDAGDDVVAAQERVVGGEGSGDELRTAVQEERRALGPLTEAARGLITTSGRFLPEQHVQPLVETLHAAAVDPSVRDDVERGRLARPLQFAGIGAATGAPAERSPASTRKRIAPREAADAETDAERRKAAREERTRRDAAQRALVRAEDARDRARARVATAVGERDEAAQRAEEARARHEAAARALADAEAALTDAHAALERAEDAADTARAELDGG
jgi:hypothetical protein